MPSASPAPLSPAFCLPVPKSSFFVGPSARLGFCLGLCGLPRQDPRLGGLRAAGGCLPPFWRLAGRGRGPSGCRVWREPTSWFTDRVFSLRPRMAGGASSSRVSSVRTPTPPWGSALVTSPPARGPASHTSRLLGDTAGSPRRSPDPPSRPPGPHRGRRCRPGHALLLRAALGAFAVFSPSIPDTCPLSLPPILVRLSLFLGQGRLLPLVSSPLEPPCARPSLVALEMCM